MQKNKHWEENRWNLVEPTLSTLDWRWLLRFLSVSQHNSKTTNIYKYKNHETSTTTYNNKRNINNKETKGNNYMILTLISSIKMPPNTTLKQQHNKLKFTTPPSSPSTLEAKPAKPSKLQSPWRRSKNPGRSGAKIAWKQPIGSMYGRFTYVWLMFMVNV